MNGEQGRLGQTVPHVAETLARSLALAAVVVGLGCSPERGRSGVERDQAKPVHPANAAPAAPSVGDSIASRAAARMAATFTELGLDPAPAHDEGPGLRLGELELELRAEILHRSDKPDAHLLVAQVEVLVDAQPMPAFTAELVGFGPTPADALELGLDAWYGQHGALVCFALAELEAGDRFHPPRAGTGSADYFIRMLIDGVGLYLSPVGLRGAARVPEALTTEAFSIAMARVALAHVRPDARYRGVSLGATIEAGEVSGLTCMVDGRERPALCEALAQLDWPAPAPSYMYSQAFVLLGPKSMVVAPSGQ